MLIERAGAQNEVRKEAQNLLSGVLLLCLVVDWLGINSEQLKSMEMCDWE